MFIRRQQGLSLVEILIFMVIVGVGIAGMLSTFGSTLLRSADPMLQKQLLAIAESTLEDILARDFAPTEDSFVPSSQACETFRVERSSYDNVEDYHGIDSCPIYSLADSTIVPGLENYRLTINAQTDNGLNALSSSDAIRVRVTVWQNGLMDDQSLTLEGWRTRYGP